MGKLREPLDQLAACGLPQALEVTGERWSFMILRGAFNGLCHFEEFLGALGIAAEDRRKIEYRLTDKGLDLLPALLALKQWGEKYTLTEPSNPVVVDARDWLPVRPITICAHDGRELAYADLRWQERSKIGQNRDLEHGNPHE